MRLRPSTWRRLFSAAAASAVVATAGAAPAENLQNRKPSISVKASPPVGFAPLRVVETAEIKGGAKHFEELYCATVERDWGDGTKSEAKADCDPFEAGKREFKRRYVEEHTFRSSGYDMSSQPLRGGGVDTMSQPPSLQHRVRFVLKQKGKTVGSGQTTVEVRQTIGGE
jgi:hypothetical protein